MTAPPNATDLVVPKGTTWRYKWTLTDRVTGDPVDLTVAGYSARGQVRTWYGVDAVLYEWDSAGPNLALRANGELEILVTAAESTAWDWWQAVYDIELIAPNNEPVRVAGGTISVSPEVTQ